MNLSFFCTSSRLFGLFIFPFLCYSCKSGDQNHSESLQHIKQTWDNPSLIDFPGLNETFQLGDIQYTILKADIERKGLGYYLSIKIKLYREDIGLQNTREKKFIVVDDETHLIRSESKVSVLDHQETKICNWVFEFPVFGDHHQIRIQKSGEIWVNEFEIIK